jgi:hypothetical protein
MAHPRWDPDRPVPPDDGAAHTHVSDGIAVTVARAAPGNDIPVGEWPVLLTLKAVHLVEPGHRLAWVMTPEQAIEIAGALVQAAGDLTSGRIEGAAR